MSKIDLSIIIPAYNEESRITATLKSVHKLLARSDWTFEIVVVDDGSSDNTVEVVRQQTRSISGLRCIMTSPNRGKGHAVRVGMMQAKGQVRLMVDADGSIPAIEIPRVVAPVMAEEADICIGSRYASGAVTPVPQPAWRRLWSRLCHSVVQRSLVRGIQDTQCGFKAFSAVSAEQLFSAAKIDGWAFDLEILALANRRGMTVHEVPITWNDDPRSRVNPLADFLKVVGEWLRIRRNLRSGVYGPLPVAALPRPQA